MASAVTGESAARKHQRKATEFMAGVLGPQGKPPVPAGDDAEFEVEKIVDLRLTRSVDRFSRPVEYRVRWKGFDSTGDTWEPAAGLNTAKRKVDAFKVSRFNDVYENYDNAKKEVLSLEDKNDKLHDKVELWENIHEEGEVLLKDKEATINSYKACTAGETHTTAVERLRDTQQQLRDVLIHQHSVGVETDRIIQRLKEVLATGGGSYNKVIEELNWGRTRRQELITQCIEKDQQLVTSYETRRKMQSEKDLLLVAKDIELAAKDTELVATRTQLEGVSCQLAQLTARCSAPPTRKSQRRRFGAYSFILARNILLPSLVL